MRSMFVYIMASHSRALYTGVTNDLRRRVVEHKCGLGGIHTAKYKNHRLVYFEEFSSPREAIAREKEIKSWTREKRIALIESTNLGWLDLADGWPRVQVPPKAP
jgi:putative endonuclease